MPVFRRVTITPIVFGVIATLARMRKANATKSKIKEYEDQNLRLLKTSVLADKIDFDFIQSYIDHTATWQKVGCLPIGRGVDEEVGDVIWVLASIEANEKDRGSRFFWGLREQSGVPSLPPGVISEVQALFGDDELRNRELVFLCTSRNVVDIGIDELFIKEIRNNVVDCADEGDFFANVDVGMALAGAKTVQEIGSNAIEGCDRAEDCGVPPSFINGSRPIIRSRVDKVHLSVSSLPIVRPEHKFIVDVWAHLERQRAEVFRRVQQANIQDDSPPVIRPKGPFKIERGTTLFVRLKFPELHVEPSEDVILWEGEIGNASFVVAVPAEIEEGSQFGLVTVHLEGGLQVARLPIQIHVETKVCARSGCFAKSGFFAGTEPRVQSVHYIRKAFASYASADRDEVLGRIQGMQKILPDLDVFLDVVNLRSGEDWEKTLWRVIPENDVFYLFWSAAAKASPWVEKEWRCALSSCGERFIDPVPLVPPDDVPPPDELSKIHFNDWSLAYRRGKPKAD